MTRTGLEDRHLFSLLLALALAAGALTMMRPAAAQVVAPQAADLSIQKFDFPPDQVAVGEPLSYELAVANNGPGTATGVVATDTLPSNTRFLTLVSGPCTNAANTVTCNVGELASNQEVIIEFTVCPVATGTATNRATVRGATLDPIPANDTAVETTRITPGSGGCAAPPARPDPAPQPNAAPVARNESYRVGEDRTLTVRRPGVLRNDRDPDGDRLRTRTVKAPRHGRLTLRADGSFVYRPDRNYNGLDGFVYAVSDGRGGTDRAKATLRVRLAPEPGRPGCDGGASAEGSDASTCSATAKNGNASAGDAVVARR